MRVLVTGSNGLLGQKLVELLMQQPGLELWATGLGESRYPLPAAVNYRPLDIRDAKAVQACWAEARPEAVVHAAAMTNVDACELQKEDCDAINVLGTQFVVEACAQHQSHLIHISTDFIFNGNDGPYDETGQPDPVSHYGLSKWKAEQTVIQSSLKWAILRTVLVYGVTQGMARSNIVLWARNALQSGNPVRVVNDQFRSPTLAEDLAMACWLAIQRKAEGIYHISGPDMMGIDELVRRVASFWNLPLDSMETVSSSTLNQPARRPPRTGFIIDKAIRELGYAPHTFEEGLALVQSQVEAMTS
ncbi:MAG: SDR family oxidoreductase [Bacteroidetes bacterium]|jgi:dTDP-4-dehydrorhamnose reductase|nr:SDR family oxidoreductase [Bacteroidota bacterium]